MDDTKQQAYTEVETGDVRHEGKLPDMWKKKWNRDNERHFAFQDQPKHIRMHNLISCDRGISPGSFDEHVLTEVLFSDGLSNKCSHGVWDCALFHHLPSLHPVFQSILCTCSRCVNLGNVFMAYLYLNGMYTFVHFRRPCDDEKPWTLREILSFRFWIIYEFNKCKFNTCTLNLRNNDIMLTQLR